MGKKNFSRGGGRGRGRGRGGSGGGKGYGPRSQARSTITEADKHNEKFERYYNELNILDEDERRIFWDVLRTDLPNSFRFTGSRGHALVVQKRLIDHYIPEIISVTYDGERVAPPAPVQWYPDQLAWSMTTPKQVIRKFPPFASFQKFLVSETSVGNISRQEVVSMIPPIMMDIKPGMTVLDLCAAPGSKTAQLIEMVHGGEERRVRTVLARYAAEGGRELSPERLAAPAQESRVEGEDDWSDDGRSTGLLIANDIEYRRAQMLVHQVKRLNSPNIIVMNHDATMFPSIKMPSRSGSTYLKFDRILADVPCSGDGTCRKNPEAWTKWTPGNALGLYTTQVRILVRALQMLKVGGRVVYSTCSMNPVEDEAVVASAIDRCGGTSRVKILDSSGVLPGLARKPSLRDWKIMDKSGHIWSSWAEVDRAKESDTGENLERLAEGMFTPKEDYSLERCIRIYPHLQNTGGFFIAVLEKQTEIKARNESEPKQPLQSAAAPASVSITSLVDEIESRGDDIKQDLAPLESLNKVIPSAPKIYYNGDAPAAARQNQTDIPNGQGSARKRSLDAEADAYAAIKKPKFRDNVDDPAPEGAEDRIVHWPPPPGAQLDLTSHDRPSSLAAPIKKKSNQPHEEPFKYLASDHSELLDIYRFYELSPRFPRDRFMVRNATGEPVKAIYYTCTLAREILRENEGKGMKFVHCGVKMFMKQDVQNQPDACKWRIQSEGLPIVEPWVGEQRVVRLWKRPTLRKLLVEMFPKVSHDGWRDLGEIGERVLSMSMGCCILRVEPREGEEGFGERLVMPLWRGISSLNLMLPKEERKAMLLRLYNDDTPLIDHSKERFGTAGETRVSSEHQTGQDASAVEEAESMSDDEEGGVSLHITAGSAESTAAVAAVDQVDGDLVSTNEEDKEGQSGFADAEAASTEAT